MKRHISIAAMSVALLIGSFSSAPSQAADDYNAYVESLITDEIIVQSNGSSYHRLAPLSSLIADVHVTLDTGVSGKIVWFTTWLGLGKEDIGHQYWPEYREDGYHKSFDPRPKSWTGTVTVSVPEPSLEQFALGQCNYQAQNLREQGLSNTAIFAEDRPIELAVVSHLDFRMTGPSGNPLIEGGGGWESYKKVKLVCQKWPGVAIPQAADDISVEPPRVEQASLTLLERSSRNGVCKIILSGVIQTSQADVDVSFRYKDNAGHQSEVYSVTTDHAKTAMFSHEYDIPNNPDGGESGKVRMVGISHDFTSAWADYEMDCVAPATESYQALLPPTVQIQVVSIEKVMVGRQLCVSKLKLIAKAVGRSATMSGQGAFVGDYYISEPQPYEIEQDEIVLFGAERELDWTQDPQSYEAAEPTPTDHPKSQTVMIGFNLTGESNTVVASVPKKPYTYTCVFPTVNPAVVGGNGEMSAAPRPNPAPSKSPQLRLAPRAADGAPGQPATPPKALQRLQQQPQGASEPTAPVRRKQHLRLKQ